MPVNSSLIRRSGDLKRQMREFAEGPGHRAALQQAFDDRFGKTTVADEGEISDFFDHFLMEYKLPDGRTMVEHFVEAHPELPAAEREMLLGWRDVLVGMFGKRIRLFRKMKTRLCARW